MKLNLTLGSLALANIAVTVAIQWYVVTTLGVGVATDALFAAMAVPQLVLAIVSGSLTHVLVPLLATEDATDARRTGWGFFVAITAIFTALALVLGAAASSWVKWLFPGFGAQARELTVVLTRIQLLGMIFTAALSVLWSVYNARRQFVWAELSPVLAGIVAILFLIPTLPRLGIRAAAWAMVLRNGLQLVFLMPGLGRWLAPDWGAQSVRQGLRRIRTLLLGTLYYKTDPLIDRVLSSMAPRGDLSLLALGQQLYGVAMQVLGKAISSPLVPSLASDAAVQNWRDFRIRFRRALGWVIAASVAGYLLVAFVGEPVLRALIGHGGITRANVHALWWIMLALFGYFFGGGMGQVLASSFYAQGDTRTPTVVGVIGFTFGIGLKIAGFVLWGVVGVALGASAYYLLNVCALWVLLERRLSRHVGA